MDFLKSFHKLEQKLPEITSQLVDWININTGSDNISGLNQFCGILMEAFKPLGGDLERISLPSRYRIDNHGVPQAKPVGDAIRIIKRPHLSKRVVLAGHMDTVFPAHSLFQTGTMTSDGKILGPGAADMKGGLMVMLQALRLFETLPCADKLGWEIIINPDEEMGSSSSESLYIEAAKRCQLGLIFEPSIPDGAFVSARKGSANYVAIAKGRAAHAGRDFHSGSNAIVALARLATSLHDLSGKLHDTLTINIGQIEGGGPINIVPDFAICRFNMRCDHRDTFDAADQAIKEEGIRISANSGVQIEIIREGYRAPKPFDAKTEHLFYQIKQCGEQLSQEISWRPSGGVCDGNILAEEGVPTIDTLGAIGGNIHTHDEYAIARSLIDRALLTATFLVKWTESP